MNYEHEATLIEDRDAPGSYRVESFDDDGACSLALFSGPKAKECALIFAGTAYDRWADPEAIGGI